MDWIRQTYTFILAASVGCLLTLTSLLAGILFLDASVPSVLEIAAVFTSFACTFLFVLERRQAYLWGFATTPLYSWLFYSEFNLPGSALVQLYLFGALVYGFFRWGPDGNPRPVTTVKPFWLWLIYAAVSGVTWYGATLLIQNFNAPSTEEPQLFFGLPVPVWDSMILAMSILAQWLLDNKKIETWGVWILVNAIAVPVYFSIGANLVAAQYVIFGLNAVWALTVWYRSMVESSFLKALRQGTVLKQGVFRTTYNGKDL